MSVFFRLPWVTVRHEYIGLKSYQVSPFTSVQDVKQLLYEETDLPVKEQRLTHNGRVVCCFKYLYYWHITQQNRSKSYRKMFICWYLGKISVQCVHTLCMFLMFLIFGLFVHCFLIYWKAYFQSQECDDSHDFPIFRKLESCAAFLSKPQTKHRNLCFEIGHN